MTFVAFSGSLFPYGEQKIPPIAEYTPLAQPIMPGTTIYAL